MTYLRWVRLCTFSLGLFSLPVALVADVYTVTNSETAGPGSLAQAVNDANLTPGPHQIVFAIPGPGVHKIDLSGDGGLVLQSSITIDGYTQPGASANTLSVGDNAVILIQLDGGGLYRSKSWALTIAGDSCVVRGLSFTGFTHISSQSITGAIFLSNAVPTVNNLRVEGNFIGLSPDGVTLGGNDFGVLVDFGNYSQETMIGGDAPAARNIISGNLNGISNPNDATIAGNYVGTDASGLRQGYGNGLAIMLGNNNFVGTGDAWRGECYHR